jgi:hypothetical protein
VLLAVRRFKIIRFFVTCVTTTFVPKIVIFKNMPNNGRNIDADARYVEPLVMGIRVMKEWMIIKYKDPDEYKRVLGLFKEAMAFVSLKAGKKMSIFLRIHNLLATNSPNRVSQSQPRMVQ